MLLAGKSSVPTVVTAEKKLEPDSNGGSNRAPMVSVRSRAEGLVEEEAGGLDGGRCMYTWIVPISSTR